jgi:predicted DNA binding protein
MKKVPWPTGFIDAASQSPPYGFPPGLEAGDGRMIRARFRLALSEDIWVNEVSTAFPDATLRLLTGVPKGDRALELGEIRAENVDNVADAIRTHPDIFAYDQLFASDRRGIAQYEADERGLYEFLWESSLPPEFPIVAENGRMEFALTATQEQFEAFGAALDETDRQYELLSLVHTDEDDNLLTERQRECLQTALHQGYFEVPRECTLAELSEAINVDKSTASETIRRGQARVLKQYLVGPE